METKLETQWTTDVREIRPLYDLVLIRDLGDGTNGMYHGLIHIPQTVEVKSWTLRMGEVMRTGLGDKWSQKMMPDLETVINRSLKLPAGHVRREMSVKPGDRVVYEKRNEWRWLGEVYSLVNEEQCVHMVIEQ